MAEESTTTDRRTFLSSTCAAGCCAYAGGAAWGEEPSAWTVGARRAAAAITARGHVHPSPLRTLSGRQGVLPDLPPVPRAVLAARVLPVPHLLPGRLVLLDPRTELPVIEPAARITVTNRPPWAWRCSMASAPHSLLSATYKNAGPPCMRHRAAQLASCVRASLSLPASQRNWTGTPPSRVALRMTKSCYRSGRWSFEWP